MSDDHTAARFQDRARRPVRPARPGRVRARRLRRHRRGDRLGARACRRRGRRRRAAAREKAEAAAARLRGAGHRALGLAMDAHSVASIRAAVDAVAARARPPRHPGQLRRHQPRAALLEVTEEAFDEVFEVNLKAAMFLAQAAARHQIAARPRRAPGALPVGALAARHARPRLLGLLRQQGRARDAGQAARDGARAARHHGERHRADLRAHRDDRAPSRATRLPRADAAAHPARPRRRAARRRRARRCSSARPAARSSPARRCTSTAGSPRASRIWRAWRNPSTMRAFPAVRFFLWWCAPSSQWSFERKATR